MERLMSWRGQGHKSDEQIAIYLSSSVVATAVARFGELIDITLDATPIDQLSQIGETLARQVNALGLHRHRARHACNLILSSEMYNLVLLERPEVEDSEVVDALRWRLQEHIDIAPESAAIDAFELPLSASRERRMLYVAALPKDFLATLNQQVQDTGLSVSSIDISELALRNFAYQCFPAVDQNVALLRLTSNSGLINISRGDELYLTRRIKGVPEILEHEQWEDFSERLLLQVQRSIDYYESAMGQPHCDVLLVTCTHDWSAVVTQFFRETLPVPIRTIDAALTQDWRFNLQGTVWTPDTAPTLAQLNLLAAGLPAVGGALRYRVEQSTADAA